MIQYHVYPGGKKRIVTFSYDDGPANDERLIALFNKYGVKGSFHLNSNNYRGMTDDQLEGIRKRYEGHEISCHTVHHGWASRMPMQSLLTEVFEDRRMLEKIAGYPVTGMSYPSGAAGYDADVIAVLRSCGIVYSRTTVPNNNFDLPNDFLMWNPTCHHKNAMPLADQFLKTLDSEWTRPLFYIWGHSFEFAAEDDWAYMETLVKKLANSEKIWYATNIEIYDYFSAQKQLKISADETVFTNPTALDLWVEKDKRQIIRIPACSTVRI